MKIGLYLFDTPAGLGGGHVLRNDLAVAAAASQGRHSFEMLYQPSLSPEHDRRLPARIGRKLLRSVGIPTPPPPLTTTEIARRKRATLLADVSRLKLDMVWFSHYEPIQADVPYILSIFDLQHRLQPWFPEIAANGQWELREQTWKEAIRRASIVTVGSEEARQQLCHFYGIHLDNVKAIPFPTPQKAIAASKAGRPDADIRSKYGIRGDFLFYPAQFWPHKNHVNLLKALSILVHERKREITLVMTGADHGNQAYVESWARKLEIERATRFCGLVPYDDVLAFYKQASALSYVSFFGPENLPPLEAMALRCPVVLSGIKGTQELFSDTVLYVDPRSPDSIAAAIERVLDFPDESGERAARAQALAVQNSTEKYMSALQGILDDFAPVRDCWI